MWTEMFGMLLLDNVCLASEKEATSMIPMPSHLSITTRGSGDVQDSELSGCDLCGNEVWVSDFRRENSRE